MRLATLTAPMAHKRSLQDGHADIPGPLVSLITLEDDPVQSAAGRVLQGLVASGTAYIAKGRLFTRGFAVAGATWEGKARRGERFGVHLWEDNSLLLWRQDRAGVWALYPSPLEILPVWKIQGVSYTASIQNGQVPVLERFTRSITRHEIQVGPLFEGPAFDHQMGEDASRALAITQATLLQNLSDLADTIPQQPRLQEADDKAKPGTNRMIAPALLASPLGDKDAREAALRALVEPLLAQAVARKAFQGKALCRVESGSMAPNGSLAGPPTLAVEIDETNGGLAPSGHRAYLFHPDLSEGAKALHNTLVDAFAQAWTAGALGNPYHWIHADADRRTTVARFSFDSEGLTAHQLLALLTPAQAPEKARSPRGPHPSVSTPLPA